MQYSELFEQHKCVCIAIAMLLSAGYLWHIDDLRKVRIGTILECPAQSGNSHFVGRSRNSYFAQCNSEIAPAQNGNRDKVRIRMIALVSSLLIILNRG